MEDSVTSEVRVSARSAIHASPETTPRADDIPKHAMTSQTTRGPVEQPVSMAQPIENTRRPYAMTSQPTQQPVRPPVSVPLPADDTRTRDNAVTSSPQQDPTRRPDSSHSKQEAAKAPLPPPPPPLHNAAIADVISAADYESSVSAQSPHSGAGTLPSGDDSKPRSSPTTTTSASSVVKRGRHAPKVERPPKRKGVTSLLQDAIEPLSVKCRCTYKVWISEVCSPSHFWVQLADNEKILAELMYKIGWVTLLSFSAASSFTCIS